MPMPDHVLVADDDETLLLTTAELLRQEGYTCSTAVDADAARRRLAAGDVDVLVADIKMPGNEDLSFVKSLASLAPGLPVVLVTGYPTLESAMASIQLPVVAYLVKPLDHAALRKEVRSALDRARIYQGVCRSQQRLEQWREQLLDLKASLAGPGALDTTVSARGYLEMSLQNIVESVAEITRVVEGQADGDASGPMLEHPRLATQTAALFEAITVLNETKGAFKSKRLGELRRKLTAVVRDDGDGAAPSPGAGADGSPPATRV